MDKISFLKSNSKIGELKRLDKESAPARVTEKASAPKNSDPQDRVSFSEEALAEARNVPNFNASFGAGPDSQAGERRDPRDNEIFERFGVVSDAVQFLSEHAEGGFDKLERQQFIEGVTQAGFPDLVSMLDNFSLPQAPPAPARIPTRGPF